MYVAIEGIKGSGKSTMIDSIYSELRAQYDLDVFSITAPCIEESSNKLLKGIKEQALTDDVCKEYLFFKRACLNQKRLKPNARFVLGDRSVLTSYVTRWDRWEDPFFTMKRVDEQYKCIMKPDVFIWLRSNPNIARNQINKRQAKILGSSDETISALEKSDEIYRELFSNNFYASDLSGKQIVMIDHVEDKQLLKENLKSVINFYINKNN